MVRRFPGRPAVGTDRSHRLNPSIILPLIVRLTDHPDAKVRSKAALLVGRGKPELGWVRSQLAQQDARVRANAVEALWDWTLRTLARS